MPTSTTHPKYLRTLERRRDFLVKERSGSALEQATVWVVDLFKEIRSLEDQLNINIVSLAQVTYAYQYGLFLSESQPTSEPFFYEDMPECTTVVEAHLINLEHRLSHLQEIIDRMGDETSTYDLAEHGALLWATNKLHEIQQVERGLQVRVLDLAYTTLDLKEVTEKENHVA